MSGLWSFRQKNPGQTLDSVLSALPTASVPVVASSSLHLQEDYEGPVPSSSSSSRNNVARHHHEQQHSPSVQQEFLIKSALAETEDSSNSYLDPDWAELRKKWMSKDLLHQEEEEGEEHYSVGEEDHQLYSHLKQESNSNNNNNNNFAVKEAEAKAKREDAAAKQWLYQASPGKASPSQSPSPTPMKVATSNEEYNNNRHDYDDQEERGKSLSLSLDRRRGTATTTTRVTTLGASSSSSLSPLDDLDKQNQHRQVDGDVVDYRSLLARIEHQVFSEQQQKDEGRSPISKQNQEQREKINFDDHQQQQRPPANTAPSFSPPPRLSPQQQQVQKQQLFTVFSHPSSSSFITAAPMSQMSTSSSVSHHNNHDSQQYGKYSTNPKAAALARANKRNLALARTSANLEEIVEENHQSFSSNSLSSIKKKQNAAPTPMSMQQPSSRSAVSTKLDFAGAPTNAAEETTSKKLAMHYPQTRPSISLSLRSSSRADRNNSSSNEAGDEAQQKQIAEALKKSQQATRAASSVVKKVKEIEKPSKRAEIHKAATSKFADPNSKEFKTKLNKDLDALDQQKKLREKNQVKSVVHPPTTSTTGKAPVRPASSTAYNSNHKPQQQQQPSSSSTSNAPAFVDRMTQRTKERDEARRQLLQKYEEEKQAKIARQIQEAQEDAQRTLAERTKAAKLREKMQRKMREDSERKDKLEQLDQAREKLADAMCHRHFIGHCGFYPWRRYVQIKNRAADLLHDRQLLRSSFNRLKQNVVFHKKVNETLFVTRCVGLSRVLKRWTLRFGMMKLRQNVLASKRDRKTAQKMHLRNCLRKWNRKAKKQRSSTEASKEKWADEQCDEAANFRERMQVRSAFRKWTVKLDKKKLDAERQKIRSRMWQVAMSALE